MPPGAGSSPHRPTPPAARLPPPAAGSTAASPGRGTAARRRQIRVPGMDVPVRAWLNYVGHDCVQVLGLSRAAGRECSGTDSAAQPVAMIIRDLADTLWPGEPAIGRMLLLGAEQRPLEVV